MRRLIAVALLSALVPLALIPSLAGSQAPTSNAAVVADELRQQLRQERVQAAKLRKANAKLRKAIRAMRTRIAERSQFYVPDGPIKDHLMRIHACEGAWNANTGNGFYGGLQFMLSTWHSVGGRIMPHLASIEEQLYRGYLLYRRSGPGQWPVCQHR